MAVACRIDGIQTIPPEHGGGRILLYTVGQTPLPAQASGNGRSFGSIDEVRDWVLSLESQWPSAEEFPLKVLIAMWHARDPNFSNPGLVIGRVMTVDVAAANIGNVLKVQ